MTGLSVAKAAVILNKYVPAINAKIYEHWTLCKKSLCLQRNMQNASIEFALLIQRSYCASMHLDW